MSLIMYDNNLLRRKKNNIDSLSVTRSQRITRKCGSAFENFWTRWALVADFNLS